MKGMEENFIDLFLEKVSHAPGSSNQKPIHTSRWKGK